MTDEAQLQPTKASMYNPFFQRRDEFTVSGLWMHINFHFSANVVLEKMNVLSRVDA